MPAPFCPTDQDREAEATPPPGLHVNDHPAARPWRFWPQWISLLAHAAFISGITCCHPAWPALLRGLLLFDALLLVRFLVARWRGETGWGWIVCLLLLWGTLPALPFLIKAVAAAQGLLHRL